MSKAFLRSAKNLVNGYSQAQVLVRKLTSNDKEGPTVDQLEELADRSFENVEFFEIMDMLDKRLNDKGRNWRHVAKSLTCLDYLVRCGSENCVFWCKENLYIIKTLREFTHTDEFTEIDHGEIVRVKAKELTALLRDEERLREERMMRLKGRKRGDRRKKRDGEGNENDDELQRALEESRITAEEEERRRKQLMMQGNDSSLQTALELSKEEEELRRLQQLQAQQQAALWQQQQQQQQQPMYYDIFGNPISAEEYMQYQQQQMLAQQQQEQYMAEQQYLAAQQQYLAQQQLLAQQQQQQQQQLLAQQQKQQFQMPYQTGSNNPFALNKPPSPQQTEEFEEPDFTPVQLPPSPVPQPVVQSAPQPVPKQRTGNQSVSDKFSELNNLLASGTGIDTFGNTGDTRLPAQHTKTGTFINSQGTGYKQVTNEPPKHNPFLTSQYTGIPSSGIAPSYTGYGFGNQPQSKNTQQNTSSNHYGNGTSNNPNLIDL